MPMLVGEVRCAILASRPSWTLSTGSAWSSGPMNASKYLHVARATSRRNCRSSGPSSTSFRADRLRAGAR